MKTKFYFFLIVLSFLLNSCNHKNKEIDLEQLNGYWEIETVETTDQKVRQYNINTTVEYFYLDSNFKGYRKKATADISGKYRSNNRKDSITIKDEDGVFFLKTNTQIHSQKEKILELTQEKLLLENETGNKYFYKRHQKLDFN
ncbi:hypothetical protein [Pseudofulvibacter geojedonensis]|uniref:Lipocalin-like domain-containing protein n=1 Tax=Pseudofulvibacter geojedonensis TaxID=1123758 RepID=A0ABW3I2C4_9FLAO